MRVELRRLFWDEDGATAVDYGLIVAAIAAVITVMVFAIGKKTNNSFSRLNANMP